MIRTTVGTPKHHGFGRFALFQTGTLTTLITALMVWPLIAAWSSKSELGTLALLLSIASLAAPGLCLGLHLYSANKLIAAEGELFEPTRRTVRLALAVLAVMTVLCAAAGLLDPSNLGYSGATLALANSCFVLSAGISRGLDRAFDFAALTIGVQVVGLSMLGWLVGLDGTFGRGVAAYSCIALAGSAVVRIRLGRGTARGGISAVIQKSAILVPHLILTVALLMMMRILVGLQLGTVELASYQFASLVIAGSMTVAAALDAYWSVRAQRLPTRSAVRSELRISQERTQAVLFILNISIAIFVTSVIEVWLPQGYDPKPIAVAVALAMPASCLQAYADGQAAYLFWSNREAAVSVSTTAGVALGLIAAACLIPVVGWTVVGLCISLGGLLRVIAVARFVGTADLVISKLTMAYIAGQIATSVALLIVILY